MNRRTPIKPVRRLTLFSSWFYIRPGTQFLVNAMMASELRCIVEPAAVVRVDLVVHPITTADRNPIFKSNPA
ncbi:hypothetical protein ES703_58914 [subsurface metagenome]